MHVYMYCVIDKSLGCCLHDSPATGADATSWILDRSSFTIYSQIYFTLLLVILDRQVAFSTKKATVLSDSGQVAANGLAEKKLGLTGGEMGQTRTGWLVLIASN